MSCHDLEGVETTSSNNHGKNHYTLLRASPLRERADNIVPKQYYADGGTLSNLIP
jgi:hypothetical protein